MKKMTSLKWLVLLLVLLLIPQMALGKGIDDTGLDNSGTDDSGIISTSSSSGTDDTEFTIGQKTYYSNGSSLAMDVAPFIKNGRTLVPVRYLALAIGVAPADILWDAAKMQMTMKKGAMTVVLTIGSSNILVNGQVVRMDTAPLIDNQRTFLPARYVAEAFGFEVEWESERRVVKIHSDNQTSFEVEIEDFVFRPATITVHQGDSVTWKNRDTMAHTATGDSFDSGRLDLGESFTFTFNQVGTFDYICTFHPTMKGKVIVEP